MTTFGELESTISQKSAQDFSSAVIQSEIKRAIRYYQKRRFWFNQNSTTITLTTSNPLMDIASITDFLYETDKDGFVVRDSQIRYPLDKKPPTEYDFLNNEGSGRPYIYTYRDGQFFCYFYPDEAYTVEVNYIQKPADLVNPGDSNIFTENAERLLIYQVLGDLYATDRQGEDRAAAYFALATKEYKELQRQTRKLIGSGKLSKKGIVNSKVGYVYY